MNSIRLLNPKLFDLIQPYRVTRDEDMPLVYRASNPQGRPLHDDWAILKDTRRIDCAYRLPQPYRIFSGPKEVCRIPFKDGYPLAPETRTERGDPAGTQGQSVDIDYVNAVNFAADFNISCDIRCDAGLGSTAAGDEVMDLKQMTVTFIPAP